MPDDLVAPEGVDEASSAEEAGAPVQDVLGAAAGPPPTQPSPPVSLNDGAQGGPGQQLEEGEG